jgi:hypothetical protein
MRKGRSRWLGHMERMSEEEEDTVKTVFKNTPEGRRSVGKPRNKWLCVENCLKKMGVGGCRNNS